MKKRWSCVRVGGLGFRDAWQNLISKGVSPLVFCSVDLSSMANHECPITDLILQGVINRSRVREVVSSIPLPRSPSSTVSTQLLSGTIHNSFSLCMAPYPLLPSFYHLPILLSPSIFLHAHPLSLPPSSTPSPLLHPLRSICSFPLVNSPFHPFFTLFPFSFSARWWCCGSGEMGKM